jgi:transcriptional regulator with XRE-family HTH domain
MSSGYFATVTAPHRGDRAIPLQASSHAPWRKTHTMPTIMDEMELVQRLAFALEAAMAVRGYDDKALAELIGKSADTVGNWRRGETVPRAIDLPALAAALGVAVTLLADPPPVPNYPIAQYLVEEDAVAEALAEGLALGVRRASGRVGGREGRGGPARPARPRPLGSGQG